jgi:hypothetical protein
VRDVRLHVLFGTQTMLDCQDGSVRAVRDPSFEMICRTCFLTVLTLIKRC